MTEIILACLHTPGSFRNVRLPSITGEPRAPRRGARWSARSCGSGSFWDGREFEYAEHHFMEDIVVALIAASAASDTAAQIAATHQEANQRELLRSSLRCKGELSHITGQSSLRSA